jgi:hypothetical protein
MYNKKVLNQATANLNKAKAPVKKSDRIINSNKLLPFISSEGFKQGPPPPGTNYRIPGNTIYNPTPYNIKAVGSNGEEKFIAAGDTRKRTFKKDAKYVDEYQMKRGGTPSSLPNKKNSKGYSRSITATNRLFAQNPITKKVKSKKRKIFDPNARYYQEGGIQLPKDYSQFTNFAQTLPSNLQDSEYQYGNPDQYDLYGMWESVGKPQSFKDVQDSEYFPLQDDGSYHGFTVGSNGEFLKPMSHNTTWKEVMNSQLNTDPYFKENRLIKNEQGRLQYVPNKQKGGDASLPDQYFPETTVYATDYDKKRQLMLIDRLRQVKGAYQDWRDEAGLRQAQLKNENAGSIDSLKARIADYKKQLEEEKKNYSQASRALDILKKQKPEEWKNAKLADVMSKKGIETLRSLYSEERISDQNFRDFYNTFGKEFDPNVIDGRGPGAQYSARETEDKWMHNVPEFVDNVATFAAAAALTPAMLALAPVSGAPGILSRFVPRTLGRFVPKAVRPFLQATKTGYNTPFRVPNYSIFRNAAGKTIYGATPKNVLASIYAGKTISDTPQVLKSIGEGFTGEKEWDDVAGDVGTYAFNLATSLPGKNIKNIAGNVVKLIDKPFSQYRKNPVFGPQLLTNFDRFNNSRFNPIGRLPKFSEIRPSDLLKGQIVGSTLLNLPETGSNIGKDLYISFDPNASMQERSLAQARALRNSLMTGLSLSPVFKKTVPLYGSNFGNTSFLLDNLYKGATEGDPTSTRALLNASRLIAKQKGGTTNSYVSTLPQKKIDELIKQGYKIEYID